jgi:transcriptional regulator with PAS, ATPase and Fis domain/tetratricopeptide (TPR) repeat protein
VAGRILVENGQTEAGISYLQRAFADAGRSGDLRQMCLIQLKLFAVLSEQAGTDATAPLLAQLRTATTRLGDAEITSALHLAIGEVEAQRGFLESAARHVSIGRQLVAGTSNLSLDAIAENTLLAIALLASDFDGAKTHSAKAVAASERTGSAKLRRAAAANTGILFFQCGEFDQAIDYLERALALLPSAGNRNNGILESLAQVRLAQGRYTDCEAFLERIESSILTEKDRTFSAHRYAEVTRARTLKQRGHLSAALATISRAVEFCQRSGDQILLRLAWLTQVEILQASDRELECAEIVRNVMSTTDAHSVEESVLFECAVGYATLANDVPGALDHISRAVRLCEVTSNVPARCHLDQILGSTALHEVWQTQRDNHPEWRAGAKDAIHAFGTALLHSAHPSVVAAEVGNLLVRSGCARRVSLRKATTEGVTSVLIAGEAAGDDLAETSIRISPQDAPLIDVVIETARSTESEAAIGLVKVLLEQIGSLQQQRLKQQQSRTVWQSANSICPAGSNAVISGHMHEQMTLAERVARTTVNVLITGESGTGKEILARAVHDFSDRAKKPFVPLNCAAVPRDLLESQLFGHRRGAFTGAERDHLGLVRAAAGGTLFLDEIGEMSLELQPKLLRFLESGEISPLGEASPFTVNVRVIAATNSNLEDAVRDGRFREDLFYRLNVVRLSLRPLRERRDEIPGLVTHFVETAAREYTKGHLDVAEETMERLLLYRWPGNVRQLQNEIRRIVALAEPNSTLQPDAISADILGSLPHLRHLAANGREIAVPLQQKLLPTLSHIEYEMIKAALRENHGRLEPAAKALGISRKGLYLKRQRLGL